MIHLNTDQLKDLIHTGSPLLLDVREPHEVAICQIPGSTNIPMNQVPSHLMQFELDQEIVAICHHGMRSAAVADFLESRGFTKVMNLTGGIDAWARDQDPDMPRY